MHFFALGLPIHFIARYILQILIAHHVIFTDKRFGISHNFSRKSDLARNFYGKRTTGMAYAQHKQRLHTRTIIEHRTVYGRRASIDVVFQILIVCRYHAISSIAHKAV